jgi:hypothetical protein
VPLKPSPSTDDDDDDDDDEGMEAQLGFSLEVRRWSEPASVGSSSGVDVLVPRFRASATLPKERVSAKLRPAPVVGRRQDVGEGRRPT